MIRAVLSSHSDCGGGVARVYECGKNASLARVRRVDVMQGSASMFRSNTSTSSALIKSFKEYGATSIAR